MKKTRKFLLSIIIFSLVFIGIANLNTVNAASAGPMYLGIISLRNSGYSYTNDGRKVWKIAEYDSTSDTTADTTELIYCIRAGAGFGSADASSNDIKAYSQKFNLKDKSAIETPYSNVLPQGENYNKLMWLLDHIYTDIGNNNAILRENYLKEVIPNEFYELLTDDDIDVIQQLAIWYFTNPSGIYHYEDIELKINSIINDDNSTYKAFEDLLTAEHKNDYTEGQARQDAARALYSYFINSADANYQTSSPTTTPTTLISSNATMQTIGGNYVAGPYMLEDNNLNVEYKVTAEYKNYGTENSIEPNLAVKNINGEIVSTNKTLKELVGTEFYLIMPTSSQIAGIDIIIKSSYNNRTATYWSMENAPETEQPVVIVENTPYNFTAEASIIVEEEKPFDLSLRKYITAINGNSITNRVPTVDVTALKAGTSTTATYNHTKDPIKVEVGDIVTYTIRVYNEGKVDGYVTEITDHLPPNLEYIVDDEINIKYGWKLASSTDLKTVKTEYLSQESETTNGANKIAAYDDGDSLSYKEVQIRCKVILTETMPAKITNIADITGFTDGDGNTVTDRDSQANNVTLPIGKELEQYKDQEIARGEEYIPGQQDDDDFEKLVLKDFDLALRKFITKVNDTDITDRGPEVNLTALKNATSTTATYNHTKDPVRVTVGDTVVYTIRVYNEGEVDGYTTEITDHLPDQLEFLPNNEINKEYKWTVDATNSKIIKTTYLSQQNETSTGSNKIVAFDGNSLSYKEVKIACKVVATEPMVEKITNIADITGFTDGDGNTVKDRDSQENNVEIPSDLPRYKDDEISKDYVPGQQDDDDFEKLMIKYFDLSLRKFITVVNDEEITNRIPTVDVTKLKAGTSTTATYNHSKDPVQVTIGDTVIYTIRVYNEGEVDGYVNEITDHLPNQLEYLPDHEINKEYNWIVDENDSQTIKTNFLSQTNETSSTGSNKISAFTGTRLSYRDVKVACKVVSTEPMVEKITNIADITEFTNGNGETVTDRDSQENNVKIPSNLPGYKDDEISKDYVPGQQDDDDFEKVVIKYFDLSLRKFITGVNSTEVTTRIPEVDVSGLKAETTTTATYNHTKDPILVANGCIVTYTIRVYNEGEINGYASIIKDDLPEGLEFIPDNEINKEYKWVMLDKDGEETEDVTVAISVVTDYLSKEQEKNEGDNLLLAYDSSTMDTLSYKDVKIAFEVTESNTSDRIIINQAQIAEDSGENGKEIEDRDSTPDEWIEDEDDQDIEKLKVQYFDLALRKWVTQAIVIENGQETITETGHKAEDDPEGVVKVDLKKSKINSVTVKFRYKIRVTNEGQIPGYVKEIKDYIPEGLKFVQEDNPLWIQVENNIITTNQAADILLKPGESTEVEVLLTWINDADNMGLKVNIAEISKDYNEFETPDIDSTPDNKKDGEDDIDDAPVILSVQTGEMQKYTLITGAVLIILLGGIVLIKKFVL